MWLYVDQSKDATMHLCDAVPGETASWESKICVCRAIVPLA